MRRGLIVLLAVVLAIVAGSVLAESTGPVELVPAGATAFQKEYTSHIYVPSKWIIYTEDASAFTLRRYFEGTLESNTFTIPASSSITISSPAPSDSSGTMIVKMVVGSHTDDVVFIPVFN